MREPPGSGVPPLDEWAADNAMRALAQFAYDLGRVSVDTAFNRLMQLTEDQRAWVLEQIDAWAPLDD